MAVAKTNSNVSPEERRLINEFCLKHQVKYYDVRLELIEYLWNQIEKIRAEHPVRSIEQGLEEVYDSFGATGFRKYVARKEEEMELSFKELAKGILNHAFEKPMVYGVWAGILYFFVFGFLIYLSGSLFSQYCFLGGILLVGLIELMLTIKIIRLNRTRKMPLLVTNKANANLAFTGISWVIITQIVINPLVALPPYQVSNPLIFYSLSGLLFTLILIGALGGFEFAEQIYRRARLKFPEAFKD